MTGSDGPPASTCRTASHRQAAGWLMRTSRCGRQTFRSSWVATRSATGGRNASGNCWRSRTGTRGGLRSDAGRCRGHVRPSGVADFAGGAGVPARRKRLGLLRGWDGSAAMDLPAPLIFNAWMEAFYIAVLRHAGLTAGVGAPVSDFVASVLSPAGAHWCDGDCAPMLRNSLADAVKDLSARFGDDPTAWRWGDAHQAVFAHPFLRNIPVLGIVHHDQHSEPGRRQHARSRRHQCAVPVGAWRGLSRRL